MSKKPIYFALDHNDIAHLKKQLELIKPFIAGVKVGPRLLMSHRSWVEELVADSSLEVFYDPKYYDIPNTMLSSIKTAASLGFDSITVHLTAGYECLKQIAKLEIELRNDNPNFKIFGVSVLTSYSEANLPSNFSKKPIKEIIEGLVKEGLQAGLTHFVCSPLEIEFLKLKFPKANLVTPGIRFEHDSQDDQVRVSTPSQALESGAYRLVMGRSLLNLKADQLGLLEQIKN